MIYTEFYKGKKVLITGSTGFKGSWLCLWLLDMGADVYGYALKPISEKDNFVRCGLDKKIKQVYGDVRDLDLLKKTFAEVKPDIVFHLAAQALVLDSYTDPRYTFETNVIGTVNFFEAVRETASVKAAVNITTDKCYKNNEWIWGYRENDPMGGEDPYSASKGCSELVTNSYIKSFFGGSDNASVASARAGNVIGGGDWAANRIIPDFFRAWIKEKPLEIRNPNAVRPWQHVLEPLNGYLLLAYNLYKEGKSYSGGWNFGPSDENNHSVGDLIDGFLRELKKDVFADSLSFINPKYKPCYETPEIADKPHEAVLLKLDISKASHFLGWKPVLDFEKTLSFTLQGYLDELCEKDIYNCRTKQIEAFEKLGLQ